MKLPSGWNSEKTHFSEKTTDTTIKGLRDTVLIKAVFVKEIYSELTVSQDDDLNLNLLDAPYSCAVRARWTEDLTMGVPPHVTL